MTDKIVITDAMVERAILKWKSISGMPVFHEVRDIIAAALNPPAEPEVVVTQAMMDAGRDAYCAYQSPQPLNNLCAAIYRAMHAACLKELKCEHEFTGLTEWSNNFQTFRHIRKTDSERRNFINHRRKGE
jgi:hypothetical protein